MKFTVEDKKKSLTNFYCFNYLQLDENTMHFIKMYCISVNNLSAFINSRF